MSDRGTQGKTTLRRATADDAPALAQLMVSAWRAAYRGLVPDSFLSRLDHGRWEIRFRESLAAGSEETYVAELGSEVVGLLTLGGSRDVDSDQGTTGEIWGIYLAPSHWRKGIGRWACKEAERMLGARGYAQTTLWVLAGNLDARRFYEAMGYDPDGASKTLDLGTDLIALRYRRTLGASCPRPG